MTFRFNPFTANFDLVGSSGGGDVVGPASSTDNAVARFDTTTGKLLQNSLVTISDTGGATFADIVSLAGNRLSNLGSPSTATDAATKQYVDNVAEGLKPKAAVRVATTANITLSGTQTIDGVSVVAGDRVLVKDQTLTQNNGIYDVAAGAWSRSADFNSLSPIDEINGAMVSVKLGTVNKGIVFTLSSTVTTLGTDPIVFVYFNSVSTLVGGNGITISGSNISVNQDGLGLQFSATQLSLLLDSTTLSKSVTGLKVATGGITNTEVNASAAIALSKLAALTTNRAVQTDGSGLLSVSATTATQLGYLSTTTSDVQTQLNGKQATLTTGNLTDTGTDGIVITGGTGSIIGSGVTLAQHVSDSTHNGYLSSTDWSTFNSKEPAQMKGSISTTTTGVTVGSGTSSTVGPNVTVNVATAAAGVTGLLTGTDWTTFNSKGSGTVTAVSVTSANGLAGTSSGGATPALTLSTTITGILQGNGTAISAATTTGTGAVVLATSPTLVTPALGTPSALIGTNITGTAAGLTAGTVTTNANLTGVITSVGNTTSIASQTGTGSTFVVSASPTITGTLTAATISAGSITTTATGDALSVGGSNPGGYNTANVNNTSSTGFARIMFGIGASGANGQAMVSYAPGVFFNIGIAANDTSTPLNLLVNNSTTGLSLAANGRVNIPSTSVASSTSTGALTVGGGLGIIGAAYAASFNGSVNSSGTTSSVRTATTTNTVTSSDDTVLLNVAGGAFTTTLPAASAGRQHLFFMKIDSGNNAGTIAAAGADTVNGGTSVTLGAQYDTFEMWSDGVSAWYGNRAVVANSANAIVRRDTNFGIQASGGIFAGTTASTSKTTGAITTAGGIGAAKDITAAGFLFAGSTSGFITNRAAATTTSYSLSWPASQGGASSALVNDGSGNLTWNPVSASLVAAPTVQKFTTGSGTYNLNYTFAISTGSATVGATYTNNGVTFTVYATVSSATTVVMSGNGAPASSGTLTKASGTGDATLTFSTFAKPLYLKVTVLGGGGGGGASAAGGNGAAGNTSSFGTTLISCGGGAGGGQGTTGAAGGTASLGTGPLGVAIAGSSGGPGTNELLVTYGLGGNGGTSPLGGNGAGGAATNGTSAATNSGSGGGGSGSATGNTTSGCGGGAGGYVNAIISSPSATYAYVVGAGGGAASGGGNGAAGIVLIEEMYQ